MLKITLATSSLIYFERSIEDSKDGMGNVNKVGKMRENLSKFNLSEIRFHSLQPRVAFTCFKKSFTKAPILYYFDPKCHIRIVTDISGFAFGGIFCQLNLNHVNYIHLDLSTSEIDQWHLVTFFFRKMTLGKI